MKRRSTNVSAPSWIDQLSSGSVAAAETRQALTVRDDIRARAANLARDLDSALPTRVAAGLPAVATGRVAALIVETLRRIARQEIDALEARISGVGPSLQSIILHEQTLKEAHDFVVGGGGLLRLIDGLAAVLRPLAIREAPGERGFEVPLLTLARRPKSLLAELARVALQAKASAPHLATTVHTNLCRAGNIDPGDDRRRPPLPDDLSGSAAEIALLAFADTPLIELLLTTVRISIPLELMFEHTHIVARIGWGKSQTLQHTIVDLLSRDDPPALVIIDSQGDMLAKIAHLACFAPGVGGGGRGRLADRLVIIDPTDVDHPPALNLFAVRHERLNTMSAANREMVMNGVIELYETLFGAILGADVTQKQGVLFRYLARLMLSIPGATIDTLRRVLEEPTPYLAHIENLNGTARDFFLTQFMARNFAATKEQVLHRLWSVLEQPTFERMFTAPACKLDLFDALQSGKIVLVNTAKDFLKTERSSILGRLFVALTLQATLERASVPQHERRAAFLVLDEAAEYLDNSVRDLLIQARKFRLGVIAAHQHLGQLAPGLADTLASQTAIKFAGGISDRDAHALARDLRTTPDALLGLERQRGAAQFMAYISGVTPTAVPIRIPFGTLEAEPRMSDTEYARLIADNRTHYGQSSPSTPPPPLQRQTSRMPVPRRSVPGFKTEADDWSS